jgi:hypothetical protein
MQKLDEIFENWTVLILFHSTSININNKHKLYYYIIPHIIFVTIGIIFIPIAFCEIHLIVISIFTIYNMNKFINNNYNNYNNITDKYIRSVLFKCGMYAIFGCICWLLDFIACKNFFKLLFTCVWVAHFNCFVSVSGRHIIEIMLIKS